MSMLPNAAHSRQLLEQARAGLVYLGILAIFAAVSLIAYVIWLLDLVITVRPVAAAKQFISALFLDFTRPPGCTAISWW